MSILSRIVLGSTVLATALVVACDQTNGCEEALEQTKRLSKDVCKETPYATTPFCAACVAAGYYSTTGPTDCECAVLAFDQSVCTYPADEEAKSEIRGAIKWANESCASFTTERRDGGTPDAAGGAEGAPE